MNVNFRYDSGDSMGSQRSSDLSLDEEKEHFRRDTERQALYQLQRVRTKPVAFAVKTNCAFDGTVDDDSPVQVKPTKAFKNFVEEAFLTC